MPRASPKRVLSMGSFASPYRFVNLICHGKPRIRPFSSLAFTLASLMVLAAPSASLAVTPGEMLKDPVLEGRARAISQQLRCVVCQNQSIDDSNAPLAGDLRNLVRERLMAGESDQEAIGFIVARYGHFVLLRPPMQINTLALWLGPLLILAIAAIRFGRYLNRQATFTEATVSETFTRQEQDRLNKLLDEGSRQ
jgi:cytochrome c-type biogenesis protein CcmH